MRLDIEGKTYELKCDPQDPYIVPDLTVAYSSQLAGDFMPVLLDPWGHGSKPSRPELIAYRLIVDTERQKLCSLYEIYWRRQDCTWKELNKDHDHDYEQIQVHFNMKTGKMEKVVVSSVGPIRHAGHGVEVYSHIPKAKVRDVTYTTAPKGIFPWGGRSGQESVTQVREIPIDRLVFENGRFAVLVLNCYHVFAGMKSDSPFKERRELTSRLEKLDSRLLERWYYRNVKNRFGHDISNPFKEPYVMYYPPPEDLKSRVFYSVLWLFSSIKRIFAS